MLIRNKKAEWLFPIYMAFVPGSLKTFGWVSNKASPSGPLLVISHITICFQFRYH